MSGFKPNAILSLKIKGYHHRSFTFVENNWFLKKWLVTKIADFDKNGQFWKSSYYYLPLIARQK